MKREEESESHMRTTHTVVRATWDDNMALLPLIWHPASDGHIYSPGELSLLSIRGL